MLILGDIKMATAVYQQKMLDLLEAIYGTRDIREMPYKDLSKNEPEGYNVDKTRGNLNIQEGRLFTYRDASMLVKRFLKIKLV
jgi:hypothetical protein